MPTITSLILLIAFISILPLLFKSPDLFFCVCLPFLQEGCQRGLKT